MDNHAISNGFISGTIAFFAHIILIFGLLAASIYLFWGYGSTSGRAISAILIAIGSVSFSFPMLAISRILEKISAYAPCCEIRSDDKTPLEHPSSNAESGSTETARPVEPDGLSHDICAFCGKELFFPGAPFCASCEKEQPQNKQQNS